MDVFVFVIWIRFISVVPLYSEEEYKKKIYVNDNSHSCDRPQRILHCGGFKCHKNGLIFNSKRMKLVHIIIELIRNRITFFIKWITSWAIIGCCLMTTFLELLLLEFAICQLQNVKLDSDFWKIFCLYWITLLCGAIINALWCWSKQHKNKLLFDFIFSV